MTNLQYTHPRNYGKDSRHCRVCHTTRGLIRKYHLDMCRRCFRERATQIGFVKRLRLSKQHRPLVRNDDDDARKLPHESEHYACVAYELDMESDASFAMLEPEPPQLAASASASMRASMGLSIEVPSRQQRDALVTESPALLLARNHRSERLFSLDAHDGIAHVDGRGRTDRPSGISITRGLPLTASGLSHAFDSDKRFPVDATALAFSPTELDMGTLVTCEPVLWYVDIENCGSSAVRLDSIEFTREGFELTTRVANAVLEPATHATVEFLFTPSVQVPEYEAFMRVFTSSGQFALRITADVTIHPLGVEGVRSIVPVATELRSALVLHNPFETSLRVLDVFTRDPIGSLSLPSISSSSVATAADIDMSPAMDIGGIWDVPPGATRTVADFTIASDAPGLFVTYVRVRTTRAQPLVAIPFVVEVVAPGVYVEPSLVHLGVLTAFDAARDVVVDVFNAADEPFEVLGVTVLDATRLNVSVTLLGPAVLPPKTRVRRALRVEVVDLSDGDNSSSSSSECVAVLALQTNSSETADLEIGELRLTATQLHGAIAYAFNDTLIGVTSPLADAFLRDDDSGDANATESLLHTVAPVADSMVVVAGTSILRTLQLRNEYNVPLELERVYVDDSDADVVTIERFERSVTASGATWDSNIVLRVTPSRRADAFGATRVVVVHVETDFVTVRVPIYVFHGVLALTTSLDAAATNVSAGYAAVQTASKAKAKTAGRKPPRTCLPVANASDSTTTDRSVKFCRTVALDVGRLSRFGVRNIALNLSNTNPVAVAVTLASLKRSRLYDLTVQTQLIEASDVAVEVAAVGRSWSNAAQNTTMLDKLATRRDPSSAAVNVSSPSKPSSSYTDTDTNTVVVPPGYTLTLQLGLTVRDVALGHFDKFLLTLETPFEVVHVHASFEGVAGAIWPREREIVAAPLFPGAETLLSLKYESSFDHDVAVESITYTEASANLASVSIAVPARSNSSDREDADVTVLFTPTYSAACRRSKYLADCAVPRLTAIAHMHPLTDFGALVSPHDMLQFERRQFAWREIERGDVAGTGVGGTRHELVATVTLHTALMTAAPVRIVAPLVRPCVTTANLSVAYATYAFALTRVGSRAQLRVHVRNPSSRAIDMELAVGEYERALFHRCAATVTSAACQREWEAAVRAAANSSDDNNTVAPLFVASRVVRVGVGATAELGPVHFFPARAPLTLETRLFVRNSLTHIEPVVLHAQSGVGALALHVVDGRSNARAAVDGAVDSVRAAATTIAFNVTSTDAATLGCGAREQTLELRNVGSFDLRVERVRFVRDRRDDDTAVPFAVRIDRQQRSDSSADTDTDTDTDTNADTSLVVPPGESVTARVVYVPDCFVHRTTRTLEVVADGATHRVPIVALVSHAAAFACLRARAPAALVAFARLQWAVVAIAALLLVVWSVYVCVAGVWALHRRELAIRATVELASHESESLSSTTSAMARPIAIETDDATQRLLDELQASAYAPVVRVETPTVTRLLLERQKRAVLAAKREAKVVVSAPVSAVTPAPVSVATPALVSVSIPTPVPIQTSIPTPAPAPTPAPISTPVVLHQAPLRPQQQMPIPLSIVTDTKARAKAPSAPVSAPPAPALTTPLTPMKSSSESKWQPLARAATAIPAATDSATVPVALTASKSAPPASMRTAKATAAAPAMNAMQSRSGLPQSVAKANANATASQQTKPATRSTVTSSSAAPAVSKATRSDARAASVPQSVTPRATKIRRAVSTSAATTVDTAKSTLVTNTTTTISAAAAMATNEARGSGKRKSETLGVAPATAAAASSPRLATSRHANIATPITPSELPLASVETDSSIASSATQSTTTLPTAKRVARPSSSSSSRGRHAVLQERDVRLAQTGHASLRSSVATAPAPARSAPANMLANRLTNSINSPSTTTVSFDSDASKALLSKRPVDESANVHDDFFRSRTFEAPFSGAFGAIGKRSNASRNGDGSSAPDSPDSDAVLVERFALPSPVAPTAAVAAASSSSVDAIDDDDDWSDLYFDSIRSEIGRLVASSSDNCSNNRQRELPTGFATLHGPRQLAEPRSFGLDAVASVSTPPAVVTSTTVKAAPPGFTSADANPFESRVAFERLRSAAASPSSAALAAAAADVPASPAAAASSRFAFASRLSLFGPSLAPSSQAFGAVGSTGDSVNGPAAAVHSEWAPLDSARASSALASLGGVELLPSAAMATGASAAGSTPTASSSSSASSSL